MDAQNNIQITLTSQQTSNTQLQTSGATTLKFKFYGIGGQGTKTLASTLGEVLAEVWNWQLAVTATYDTIVRGTDVEANLVMSPKRINSPEVVESNYCVIFNSPSDIIKSERYIADISKKDIFESDSAPTKGKTQYYDLINSATTLGAPIFQNMIALGILLRACKIDLSQIDLLKYLPERQKEENLKAVNLGFTMSVLS